MLRTYVNFEGSAVTPTVTWWRERGKGWCVFHVGKRREENPGRSISMVYSRVSGDPKHTLPTSLKPQEPAVHTLKGPRSCQWIEVTAKASLSAAAWLESWTELGSAQPSQAQPEDSPLPWLSWRSLLISSAASLGLHSPPTYGNGDGDSHPPTLCSRAGCMEKID